MPRVFFLQNIKTEKEMFIGISTVLAVAGLIALFFIAIIKTKQAGIKLNKWWTNLTKENIWELIATTCLFALGFGIWFYFSQHKFPFLYYLAYGFSAFLAISLLWAGIVKVFRLIRKKSNEQQKPKARH